MGYDFTVSIEIYDTILDKWITLDINSFLSGEYKEFIEAEILPSLIDKVKHKFILEDDEDNEDEILSDVLYELIKYMSTDINQNYNLFHYLAGLIKDKAGRIKTISSVRDSLRTNRSRIIL